MRILKGGLRLLATLSLALAFGLSLRRRFLTFEVAGYSMLPTYRPGDWLLADRNAFRERAPRPGEVVIATDPRDPTRTIVKRVLAVTEDGAIDLRGDNPEHSTDSRDYGPIPAASVVAKVLFRYRKGPQLP